MALLTLVTTGFSIYGINSLLGSLQEVQAKSIPTLVAFGDLKAASHAVLAQNLQVAIAIRDVEDERLDRVSSVSEQRTATWTVVDQQWTILSALQSQSPDQDAKFHDLQTSYQAWRDSQKPIDTLIQSFGNPLSPGELNSLSQEYSVADAISQESSHAFQDRVTEASQLTSQNIAHLVVERVNLGVLIIAEVGVALLLALVAAVVLGLLFARSFNHPISSLSQYNSLLAQGDFSTDLPRELIGYRDEFGHLSRSMQQVVDHTRSLLQSVHRETEALVSVGGDLGQSMKETSTAVSAIRSSVGEIRASISDQSASVVETNATVAAIQNQVVTQDNLITNQSAAVAQSSATIEQMVASLGSVGAALERNRSSIDDLVRSSTQAKDGVLNVSRTIQKIAAESEGLSQANTVIQDVAARTNLLAMNAAIEAAHAGSSGRGFAVVANEIRSLAESASLQGRAISTTLNLVKDLVDQGVVVTAATRNQFDEIEVRIREVADQEGAIQRAMVEVNQGGSLVLEAIRNINEVSSQVKDGSAQVRGGSEEIHREMAHLEKLTSNLNEMAARIVDGVSNLDAVVSGLAEISASQQKTVERLDKETKGFQIS